MANPAKPDDKLAETGKPGDPAKKDNPDTRLDQQKRNDRDAQEDATDPALKTTRDAGQGTG